MSVEWFLQGVLPMTLVGDTVFIGVTTPGEGDKSISNILSKVEIKGKKVFHTLEPSACPRCLREYGANYVRCICGAVEPPSWKREENSQASAAIYKGFEGSDFMREIQGISIAKNGGAKVFQSSWFDRLLLPERDHCRKGDFIPDFICLSFDPSAGGRQSESACFAIYPLFTRKEGKSGASSSKSSITDKWDFKWVIASIDSFWCNYDTSELDTLDQSVERLIDIFKCPIIFAPESNFAWASSMAAQHLRNHFDSVHVISDGRSEREGVYTSAHMKKKYIGNLVNFLRSEAICFDQNFFSSSTGIVNSEEMKGKLKKESDSFKIFPNGKMTGKGAEESKDDIIIAFAMAIFHAYKVYDEYLANDLSKLVINQDSGLSKSDKLALIASKCAHRAPI